MTIYDYKSTLIFSEIVKP